MARMVRALVLSLLALPVILAGAAPAPAAAQGNCEQCDLPPRCRGHDLAEKPLKFRRQCRRLAVRVESDIDFGRVVLLRQGEGKVIVDLDSGQKRVYGDVEDLGGMTITGRVTVTGTPMEAVRIQFPWSVEMRDRTAPQAQIRDFETDLPTFPTLDIFGELSFRFTGTLVLTERTQASGTLRGRVPISVSYF